MSNARIILQTVGDQDRYLTGNAQYTHFKSEHKRYSQFGTDWIIINNNFKGLPNYGQPNSNYYFRIEKNGDLINNCYLRLKLRKNSAWTKENFGIYETIFKIIQSVELMNDDSTIGKLDADYMFSYFELNYSKTEKKNLVNMISYDNASKSSMDDFVYLYLPLPFWFHKNPGCAFPLWALNNPNVGIKINTRNYDSTNREIFDIELLVDFGFLNTEEKEQFTNKSLEYLIETPEFLDSVSCDNQAVTKKFNLLKTHYVRYLVWNIKDTTTDENNFNYSDDLVKADILFNGNPLITDAPGSFYNTLARYMNFKSDGTIYLGNSNGKFDGSNINNVYTYSFCLNPLSKKLSGYFTTEKFNNVGLTLQLKASTATTRKVNIYILKHNVLRIDNGVLNLLYN